MKKAPTALRPWGLWQRHKITGTALITILLSLLYWGVIASDRYVSEAHVMIQSTSLTGSSGASGIASMLGGGWVFLLINCCYVTT